jgi:hypothetical protein
MLSLEKEQETKLKALCDDAFLSKLLEVAKTAGWFLVDDYTEVAYFVSQLYELTGKEIPDIEPYDFD